MKKKFLVLCLVWALSMVSCVNTSEKSNDAQKQALKLTLRFEQSTYHVGEPVVAIVRLENIGSETIIVNSLMRMGLPPDPSPVRDIAFDVITPTGEIYWPDINITPGPLYNTHFVELKSGESFEKIVHLDSYFYNFTEVGTYKIIANYQNILDPKDAILDPNGVDTSDNRIAWKGELNSDEVQLTIIP